MNQEALLDWYKRNKRPLPWRLDASPWSILLSEILLQQTQMERGIEYHERLLKRFPTLSSMAKASVDDVLFLWQGAGYYSRARRLHALSIEVVEANEGVLPKTYEELLKLPGIGPYTAAAIASIAFSEPVACVDGNIRRVMARQSNQEEPSANDIQRFADKHLVTDSPGEWNQAMMELGALVCKPRNPLCDQCPVTESCRGRSRAHDLPRPKTSKKTTVEYTCVVRIDEDGAPELQQRPQTGLFAGLWGPEMATGLENTGCEFVGTVRHLLSHREMIVSVWKTVGANGIDPSTVALSSLDRRILRLVGVLDDVP
ncbi:MAG: Adenine DNA glycosylase [Candidatus Poseidoniaceae archaeon]|nr:MAG: Adenine DNA glycosylase [Candidatus Poseidoniaceae archaeon]